MVAAGESRLTTAQSQSNQQLTAMLAFVMQQLAQSTQQKEPGPSPENTMLKAWKDSNKAMTTITQNLSGGGASHKRRRYIHKAHKHTHAHMHNVTDTVEVAKSARKR